MKQKFKKWHNTSISQQLDEGKVVDHIEVELKLCDFKPLHA